EEPGRERSRDLGRMLERRRKKRYAVAQRVVDDAARAPARLALQGVAPRVEVEPGPLRARDRPFGFVPLDEAIDVAHLELDPGVAVPAVVLALQEVVEEA